VCVYKDWADGPLFVITIIIIIITITLPQGGGLIDSPRGGYYTIYIEELRD